MKKSVLFAALSIALAAAADMKVASVDMLVLARNHPNYDSNKALLVSTEKDYQKKLDAIKSELEKIQDEGKKLAEQARSPMLAAAAKQKIEKDLVDIQNRFLGGQQRLRAEAMRSQQDLQDLEARLLKTTTSDLRKRIGKYAEKNGYDFIFDSNAAPYAKKTYDVTDAVLREMGVDPAEAKREGKEGR